MFAGIASSHGVGTSCIIFVAGLLVLAGAAGVIVSDDIAVGPTVVAVVFEGTSVGRRIVVFVGPLLRFHELSQQIVFVVELLLKFNHLCRQVGELRVFFLGSQGKMVERIGDVFVVDVVGLSIAGLLCRNCSTVLMQLSQVLSMAGFSIHFSQFERKRLVL